MKDRVDAGDIKAKPTKEKRGDFFTKPLQGKMFQYFRALIMGFDVITTDGKPHTLDNFDEKQTVPPKECVTESWKRTMVRR